MSIAISGSSITFPDQTQMSTATGGSFRNRIINGDMRIDQRNAGASVSFNSSSNLAVDRFKTYNTVGSGSTVQRSTTASAGFNNSMLFTVGTGASPGAADECRFFQAIEGFNVSDLGFGTASAATVTISFRVRSSITGTYALNLRNDAGNRSYVATYTIDAANTWETKTVTIAGDTSGTWATNNSTGILLQFDLGSGSNANTTAGAWQAGNFGRTSACVNWIATNGATFYITGVQLEQGSTATEFERRPIGTELALCQRYYYRQTKTSTASGVASAFAMLQLWSNAWHSLIQFPVTLRSAPSFESSAAATFFYHCGGVANAALTSINISGSNGDSARLEGGTTYSATQGLSGQLAMANSSTAFLGFSAEL
jgi:hypothetical protein